MHPEQKQNLKSAVCLKILKVDFDIFQNFLIVTIEDNGVGIETSKQMKLVSDSNSLRESIGISNTIKRIDLLNRIEKCNITVQVNELEEGGTKVKIQIQFKQINL